MSGGGWPAPGIVAVGSAAGGGGTSFSLSLPGPLVFEDTILAFVCMTKVGGSFSGSGGEVNITGTGGQFWFERVGRLNISGGGGAVSAGAWTHFITEADETGMTTMDFTTSESVDDLVALFYILDSHHADGSVQFQHDQGNSVPDIRYQGPHFYLTPNHSDFHNPSVKQLTFAGMFGGAFTASYGPPEAAPPGWTFDGIAQSSTAEIFMATKVGGETPAYVAGVTGGIEPPNYGEEGPDDFFVTYFGGALEPPLGESAPGNGWTWDAWGTPENSKNLLGYIPPTPGQGGYGLMNAQSFAAHYHRYQHDIEEDVPYWGMLCTPATES